MPKICTITEESYSVLLELHDYLSGLKALANVDTGPLELSLESDQFGALIKPAITMTESAVAGVRLTEEEAEADDEEEGGAAQ